jgi:hypothetical protein
MDFWAFILVLAVLAGIMGWCITPFVNAVLWFCDWRDGLDINFGFDMVFTVAVPFAWVFAVLEIIILYWK